MVAVTLRQEKSNFKFNFFSPDLCSAAFSQIPVLRVTPVPKSTCKWKHPSSFPCSQLLSQWMFPFPHGIFVYPNKLNCQGLNLEFPAQEMPGRGKNPEYAKGARQTRGQKADIIHFANGQLLGCGLPAPAVDSHAN